MWKSRSRPSGRKITSLQGSGKVKSEERSGKKEKEKFWKFDRR